jgi:hypothetical protein
MGSTSKNGQTIKSKTTPTLKDQGHLQVMELLTLADKSTNPDIRAAAIEIAKCNVKYGQKQAARLSPTLVLGIIVVLGAATLSACWYAFLYQSQIAYQLSAISILLFIVLSAIILSLCGILSPANLMKVFDWAISYIKTRFHFGHKESVETLPELRAESEDSISPKK